MLPSAFGDRCPRLRAVSTQRKDAEVACAGPRSRSRTPGFSDPAEQPHGWRLCPLWAQEVAGQAGNSLQSHPIPCSIRSWSIGGKGGPKLGAVWSLLWHLLHAHSAQALRKQQGALQSAVGGPSAVTADVDFRKSLAEPGDGWPHTSPAKWQDAASGRWSLKAQGEVAGGEDPQPA